MITQVWNPCAPLLLCTLGIDHPGEEPLCSFATVRCGAMITEVWNLCAPFLLCTVGSNHQGVEPLFPQNRLPEVPLLSLYSNGLCSHIDKCHQ